MAPDDGGRHRHARQRRARLRLPAQAPGRAGHHSGGPAFSPDGECVAFRTESEPSNVSGEVRFARSDGSNRHQVTCADGYYGWGPATDLLAISTATTYTQVVRGTTYRESQASRLELVSPAGARRALVSLPTPSEPVTFHPPTIWDAAWSPSGKAVAVAVDSFSGGSTIRSYPLDGGKPTTWFSIDATAQLPGLCTGCGGGNTIA